MTVKLGSNHFPQYDPMLLVWFCECINHGFVASADSSGDSGLVEYVDENPTMLKQH